MNDRLCLLFAWEVHQHCNFALSAAASLCDALEREDSDDVWLSLHTLLSAAAIVSKILWPTRDGDPQRGQELRRMLDVSEESSLRSRAVRNSLEHVDERLEAWDAEYPDGPFVDTYIGDPAHAPGTPLPPEAYLRAFDPEAQVLMFRGDRIELAPIISELRHLQIRAGMLHGLS